MKEGRLMAPEVSRRDFLSSLGVTVGAAATAASVPLIGGPALISRAEAQPKGKIPDTPYKIGHMTFFTGAAAVLGEPSYKGHILAAEEINAQGGLLGKRKIETFKADEAAGTDANVKEMRRMKLSEKIDLFTVVISSGNTPALGPVAEELKLLTIFVDGCTDFLFDKAVPNPHYIFRITNMQSADGVIAAKPDLLTSSVWGGDYIAMYKQGLRYDLFKKMKFTSMIAFGVAPHAIGKDHPEGVIGGIHSNYYWNYPPAGKWPLNDIFVKKYFDRWKEYPNFQSEGAYTTLMLLKQSVEKANKLAGGWPDDEALISQLEGASISGPAGYLHIRPDIHQGYKDAMTGFSMNSPDYPFQILDPNRIITIPIRNITAPPGWPKGEPTSTYTWIDKTWPTVKV